MQRYGIYSVHTSVVGLVLSHNPKKSRGAGPPPLGSDDWAYVVIGLVESPLARLMKHRSRSCYSR